MARTQPAIKPQDENKDEPASQDSASKENVKVVPTDVYVFEMLQYHTTLLENINNGMTKMFDVLKQAGFKVD